MKRVFIIHGWGGKPNEHWLPWLKEQLEAQGFEVSIPEMPNTDDPVIEEWVTHVSQAVGELDEQTYFVGHSIGNQAVLRYLETQADKRAGGCVFVAGWFKLEDLEEEEVETAKPWLENDIDTEKVLQTTRNFTVINSSNDPYNAVEENKRMFEERLGAKVTVLENRGHFTTDDGVVEVPEVLQAVLEQAEADGDQSGI